MSEMYTESEFSNVSKCLGNLDDCLEYVKENGGELYTRVYGEMCTFANGVPSDIWYAKGNLLDDARSIGGFGVA